MLEAYQLLSESWALSFIEEAGLLGRCALLDLVMYSCHVVANPVTLTFNVIVLPCA